MISPSIDVFLNYYGHAHAPRKMALSKPVTRIKGRNPTEVSILKPVKR